MIFDPFKLKVHILTAYGGSLFFLWWLAGRVQPALPATTETSYKLPQAASELEKQNKRSST